MGDKKRLMINLIASLMAFTARLLISFFVIPKITTTLGDGAYGIMGIANNFASAAGILTIALNAMAARFVSVHYHRNEIDKANTYFNSIVIADISMAIIIGAISAVITLNINHIIEVSPDMLTEVKMTFALVFLNFILTVITTVFTVTAFVKNRVDITSIAVIIGNIVSVVVIFVLFKFLDPQIYYVAISTLSLTIVSAIINFVWARKHEEKLKYNLKDFNIKYVFEIASSGIWNAVNNLSMILLNGLDLLVAYSFISEEASGLLGVAKTIPTAIVSLLSAISKIFTPQFTILYAKGKIKELVDETKFSIKFLSFLMTVIIAGIIIFGYDFYSLWLPSKTQSELMEIQILSVISIGPNLVSSYVFTLYSIDLVTNRLRIPALVTLLMAISSLIIEFILLFTTNGGIYIIASVSSVIMIIKTLVFVPMYAASNLKVKKTTFYPPLIRAILCFCLLSLIFWGINKIVIINGWGQFVLVVTFAAIIGYLFSFIFLFNKAERNKFINVFKKIIHGNKSV